MPVQPSSSCQLVAAFLSLLLLVGVKPIDAATKQRNDEEADMVLAMMEDDDDTMIFRGLMVFFGVCLAFIATTMGLLQLLQQCWIAEYQSKGRTVTASVHDLAPITKYQTITATIDYPYYDDDAAVDDDGGPPPRNSSAYATTIRKQIKCCQEDVMEKKSSSMSISGGCHGDTAHPDCCLMIFEDGTFSFDEAIFHVPTKLSMQVVYLPGYPHSALPKSQVAPTGAFRLQGAAAAPVVVTLLFLSMGCIYIGVRRSPLWSSGIAVGSCLLFALLLYHCIRDAMEHEYTESSGLDAETLGNLSTMASESRDQYDSTTGPSIVVAV
jgi:hypothetical protein